LKQLSAAKFGKPKAKVEATIFARLATKEDPKPAFGSNPFGPQAGKFGQPQRPVAAKKPGSGSSFLDEWLAKRKTATPGGAPVAAPAAPPAPARTTGGPQKGLAQSQSTKQAKPEKQAADNSIKNISSSQTADQEASDIAKELRESMKKNLGQQEKKQQQTSEKGNADSSKLDKPATSKKETPQAPKTQGEISIRNMLDEDNNDTIYIDRDGNLHQRETVAFDEPPRDD
jgi:hypothetical protein